MASGLGIRLKEKREARGLTQLELAAKVGIRPETISRYEREEIDPPSSTLGLIARELGVSMDWLAGGARPLESRVESDEVPESFTTWRTTMAPSDVSPEIAARMLETHFRYPPEDAWRWNVIYQEVLAEARGRRVSSVVRASEEETERARKEAEALGLPVKRKK